MITFKWYLPQTEKSGLKHILVTNNKRMEYGVLYAHSHYSENSTRVDSYYLCGAATFKALEHGGGGVQLKSTSINIAQLLETVDQIQNQKEVVN